PPPPRHPAPFHKRTHWSRFCRAEVCGRRVSARLGSTQPKTGSLRRKLPVLSPGLVGQPQAPGLIVTLVPWVEKNDFPHSAVTRTLLSPAVSTSLPRDRMWLLSPLAAAEPPITTRTLSLPLLTVAVPLIAMTLLLVVPSPSPLAVATAGLTILIA